jgi:predicted CXXCH cytochrome family protein
MKRIIVVMSGSVLASLVLTVLGSDRSTPGPTKAATGTAATVDMEGKRRGVLASAHARIAPSEEIAGVCRVCHIPHIQVVRPVSPPTTQPTTQPVLELYRMPGQRRVFVPGEFTPGPTSLICLGCHDGTIGTSTISGAHALLAGVREGFYVAGDYAWRDHPIGIPYPGNRRDFRPESFVIGEGKIKLPEGRVECVSCHDPHNESGVPKMLVMSNRRSALCLACHIK